MNVLSLFDGMSCGQIALERAGFNVENYFASETDKHSIEVTQDNYPNTIQIGDVTKVSYKNGILTSENGKFNIKKIDLICAGSPCQGFSIEGKQLAFNDPRSKLYFEFERIVNEIRPKYFMLENVNMNKKYIKIISDRLGVNHIKINSSLVSAQTRNRLYWTNIQDIQQPKDRRITFGDIEIHIEEDDFWKDFQMKKWYNKEYIRKDYYRVIESESKVACLMAQMGLNKPKTMDKNGKFRILNPIEWERLQTVPDNYTQKASKFQRYKMLGNGWTVDVIAHIFKNMKF